MYLKYNYKDNYTDLLLSPKSIVVTDINTLTVQFTGFGAYGPVLFASDQ